MNKKNTIVEQEFILEDGEILLLELREADINELNEEMDCIRFMAKFGLIKNTMICSKCNKAMGLVKNKRCVDGFMWLCSGNCKNSTSLRENSFFYKSHLSFNKMYRILYKWAKEIKQKDIAYEIKTNKNVLHTLFNLLY